MNQFWHAFAREFWTRLFWATAFGHIVILTLYVLAPTVVQFR